MKVNIYILFLCTFVYTQGYLGKYKFGLPFEFRFEAGAALEPGTKIFNLKENESIIERSLLSFSLMPCLRSTSFLNAGFDLSFSRVYYSLQETFPGSTDTSIVDIERFIGLFGVHICFHVPSLKYVEPYIGYSFGFVFFNNSISPIRYANSSLLPDTSSFERSYGHKILLRIGVNFTNWIGLQIGSNIFFSKVSDYKYDRILENKSELTLYRRVDIVGGLIFSFSLVH